MTRFRSVVLCAVVLSLVVSISGCFTMMHTVGGGATSNTVVKEQRQWFAVWGLVKIGNHDSGPMAGGRSDYTVQTQWTPLDIVMNIFTQYASFISRTITVTE